MQQQEESQNQHINIVVIAEVVVEVDHERQKTIMRECRLDVRAHENIEEGWRNPDGTLNADGLKVQFNCLTHALATLVNVMHINGIQQAGKARKHITDTLNDSMNRKFSVKKGHIGDRPGTQLPPETNN